MSEQAQLVIYGNGNMARMLFHFVRQTHPVVAFCVDESCITETEIEGLPVIPFHEIEKRCPPDQHQMLIAVGFADMNEIRAAKFREAKAKGYALASYIHPSASVAANVQLGENAIILECVSIHPYSRLGDNVFISSNTNLGHGCQIGDHCWINAGVSIGGDTVLGEHCFMGVNASAGHELSLGAKTFIGANTLIANSTEPGDVYLPQEGQKFRMKSDRFMKLMRVI
jgi:sugar O-acyltransferase (sialic acid O-acetyltransferase NeuD family)